MLPRWLSGKESTCQAGDADSIPRSGRSPVEGNGNPLQYSWGGNSTDRGDWWATVHGVLKSWTWLRDKIAAGAVYICQCHFLNSSHPLLPLLCPQANSLHLYLHSFPANRSISTISLDSIYIFTVQYLFFSFWLTSLCATGSRFIHFFSFFNVLLWGFLNCIYREDPLEKEMTTHSNTLAWKILWMEEPGRLQSMGLQRVGHNWATSLSFLSF